MKAFKLISIFVSVLVALGVLVYLEACSITGKGWEAELGPISIKMKEVEADFGKSVVIKLIESVKNDQPDKYKEAVKKICDNIKLYEQVSKNYEVLANAMNNVPNAGSMQEGFEALAKSFGDRAKALKDILREYDVDCQEF
jgi:hypothetical protein